MPDYRISIADLHAHRFGVELDLALDADAGAAEDAIVVSLPVWIPGSYLVREFARHLLGLEAAEGARPLRVEALDKATWRVHLGSSRRATTRATRTPRRLRLRYQVYGFDPSVRACFLDAERGFFNGTSLLLRVHGREHEPHRLRLGRLPRGWRVATSMHRQDDARGAHAWVAADYDEAVDHPFELGNFWHGRFEARGVEHEFVVSGAWPGFDGERLLADTKAICEAHLDFWHGQGTRRARKADVPFDRYVFMLHAVDDGHGGLEHRASTALIASRKDLPRQAGSIVAARGSSSGGGEKPDHYVTLLGLVSHEYFHAWNVKRLRPAELVPLDYTRENHTPLLWFFEGFTSYYDDLMLRRAGLIGDARYLGLVAKQINALRGVPGRRVQSVAQASWDAWTKYYRGDENTPNLTVSYYVKGALVALALDLTLRAEGRGSLDDVMRLLWRDSRAARVGAAPRRGGDAGDVARDAAMPDGAPGAIDEAAIARALRTVAGRSMERELRAWVHGTDDPPWAALLQALGVQVSHDAPGSLASLLGLRVDEASGAVVVKQVLDGGVAHRAGLAAGDEIIAFDGWRLRKLDDASSWWIAPQPFELTLVRGQRLRALRVGSTALKAAVPVARGLALATAERAAAPVARRRRRWLHGA
jgi:predicted metalloprotease with PDZ domain